LLTLARGFIEATWPELAPEFGVGKPKRRLGDILLHGKMYLLAQMWVAQPAGSISLSAMLSEMIMWHAFGDPTVEIWTHDPHDHALPMDYTVAVFDDRLVLTCGAEGATITAFQLDGETTIPVGRSTVSNGQATLPCFMAPDSPAPTLLSASRDDAVSVLLTPAGASLPDLVVASVSLDGEPSGHRGQDLAAVLSVTVGNRGEVRAPGTVNADGAVKTGEAGYVVDILLAEEPLEGPPVAPGMLLRRVTRTPDVPAGQHVPLSSGPPLSSDVGGTVPPDLAPGTYHLCMRVDPADAIGESDEANDVTCIQGAVRYAPWEDR
jgi:hypothetical protein